MNKLTFFLVQFKTLIKLRRYEKNKMIFNIFLLFDFLFLISLNDDYYLEQLSIRNFFSLKTTKFINNKVLKILCNKF